MIVAGLFIPPPARTGMWIVALVWMGTAFYYLAMIAPVLVLTSGVIPVDFYGWLLLAILILGGSMIIWWATERAWGKFS